MAKKRKKSAARKREPPQKKNPLALTPAELAEFLNVPQATINRHIEDGAPTSADGTINLVHYAAWLNVAIGRN